MAIVQVNIDETFVIYEIKWYNTVQWLYNTLSEFTQIVQLTEQLCTFGKISIQFDWTISCQLLAILANNLPNNQKLPVLEKTKILHWIDVTKCILKYST